MYAIWPVGCQCADSTIHNRFQPPCEPMHDRERLHCLFRATSGSPEVALGTRKIHQRQQASLNCSHDTFEDLIIHLHQRCCLGPKPKSYSRLWLGSSRASEQNPDGTGNYTFCQHKSSCILFITIMSPISFSLAFRSCNGTSMLHVAGAASIP